MGRGVLSFETDFCIGDSNASIFERRDPKIINWCCRLVGRFAFASKIRQEELFTLLPNQEKNPPPPNSVSFFFAFCQFYFANFFWQRKT